MQTMQTMQIQCPNPECRHPASLTDRQCEKCQTPVVRQYLWSVGANANEIPAGAIVGGRYAVCSPRIWLDTQPAQPPEMALNLPEAALPYLHRYADRLHLPGLYDLYAQGQTIPPILLLENAPITAEGVLLPALESVWASASPVRQLYWLWQLLDLWQPLQREGVTRSLLVAENVRVEGWRVRLRELIADEIATAVTAAPELDSPDLDTPPDPENASVHVPTLADLGQLWQSWIEQAQPEIQAALQQLCQQMQTLTGAVETQDVQQDLQTVTHQLNTLLLEQAAQLPLKLTIAGATHTGPQRTHNEDTCYPDQFQLPTNDGLMPYAAIVCDGVGGHEGGEIASQLALRSLKSLLRAFFAEIAEQAEIVSPEVIAEQLIEVVRIVNNQIAAQNDAQGREMRQRMGTTLVMALQVPQKLSTGSNSHELYVVHVGDSRAYWLNSQSCLRLTVDDDVAVREVRLGRSLYREARQRADAAALIQALGTRDADMLQITVQRFLIEEDMVLLLCSDGLSDHQRVEQSWEPITRDLMRGKITLESAVESWIAIANEQNGHDNASIVLLQCQINPAIQLYDPSASIEPPETLADTAADSDLTESSRALLYDEYAEPATVSEEPAPRPWMIALGLAAALLTAGAIGIGIWRAADPTGFQQTIDQVIPTSRE